MRSGDTQPAYDRVRALEDDLRAVLERLDWLADRVAQLQAALEDCYTVERQCECGRYT